MLNLKKTAVAVLALGSSAVFAGTMGPVCAPGNVTIPCERTMWEVGADALYLQPVYSTEGFNPAIIGGSTAGAYTAQLPSANWGWGFMIEGAYHYGMGNDVNINWYHVNNATNVGITQQVYYNVNTAGGAAAYVPQSGNDSIHPEWDAVNVEFGQHVDFGDMKNIRLHGGVEYARVATGSSFLTRGVSAGNDFYGYNNSTFNGFGPRGGVDMNYDLGNGFSAYGNGAGGIYVGTGSFNTLVSRQDNAATPATQPARVNYTLNGSQTTLVPELEAKLGLMYHYNMASMGALPPSELVLDVGWMWVNYFNAQFVGNADRSYAAAGTLNDTNIVSRGNATQSNFGEQGLNFGLKWKGNV